MAKLRWIVFGICVIWAIGGWVVMLGYGSFGSNADLVISTVINLGPLALSFL